MTRRSIFDFTRGPGRDTGATMLQMVSYIVAGAVVMAAISALVVYLMTQQRAVSSEHSQTGAVQAAMQEISRAIDESSSIFYATETELGVARNVTADVGGLDCRLDQYYVEVGGGEGGVDVLKQWTEYDEGACRDSYDWRMDSVVEDGASSMVHDLAPFTLVDDEGLVSAACTATASADERGTDAGYCVPLFRYLDHTASEFAPFNPVAKNTISAVKIVMSANVDAKPVPVSRSLTVSPNSYAPGSPISEVASPTCPANVTREVSGSTVTLSWVPVPHATQYRVVRSHGGTTTEIPGSPLVVSSMGNENPTLTDDISSLGAGASIVYQVLPTVNGEEATGCPRAMVSLQTPPIDDLVVEVVQGTSSAWHGARPGDVTIAGGHASLRATWGDVPGAQSYEAELREIHPGTDEPLSGWAAFDWDGTNVAENALPGDVTTIATDYFNGGHLYSRAFQVRVRAVSSSGSSPWTYAYMTPSSGPEGTIGHFADGDTLPAGVGSGYNGYLVVPAPGVVEVDDVTRAYTSSNVTLSWDDSPDWADERYNRENNQFYRVQRHQRDGVTSAVSYSATAYSNVYAKTSAKSGQSGVDAGDWSHFRMYRCNYVNPYVSNGASFEQCGPGSRVWSALGLPGIPNVNATANSSADTNSVRWGKNGATTTTDFTNQRINTYDVAEQQGGGNGTSQSSGNTSSAIDTIPASKKSSPWRSSTTATSATHDRREGDFTRYAARACNTTINGAPTASHLAGVTGEAGQGVGVESCSNWSGDSARVWQGLAQPQCTVSDTWRSITITGRFSDLYVSPVDRVLSRELTRWNTTENVSWTYTSTSNSNANWTRTWNDDGASGDKAEGTVKPRTNYHGSVRITTQYASPGGRYHGACASGTVNDPPVPNTPNVGVRLDSVSSTWGTPRVRHTWSPASSGVSVGWMQRSLNGGAYTSSSTSGGSSVNTTSWRVNQSTAARVAHTSRLASWGFTRSANANFTPNPTVMGGNGCPDAMWNSTTMMYNYMLSAPSWSGNGCNITVNAGANYDVKIYEYYRDALVYECSMMAGVPIDERPPYCLPGNSADLYTEARARANASSYTKTGATIGVLRFNFGSSTLGATTNGYRWISGGPGSVNVLPAAYSPTLPPGTGFGAEYGQCNVTVSCHG